jgi:DNA-binding response OmpR family regulator
VRGPARILVVDDYPEHRKIMRWYLSDAGFEVSEAATLAEARDALAGLDELDAIIVDGTLPDGDGLELVAAIRADPRGRAKAVFVLSGHAGEEDRARGLSAGATDYFAKPVDYAVLTDAISAEIRGEQRL